MQKVGILDHFPIFRLFFLFSGAGPWEAETYIFPIFFPISGRRPETYSVASQRDRNPGNHELQPRSKYYQIFNLPCMFWP